MKELNDEEFELFASCYPHVINQFYREESLDRLSKIRLKLEEEKKTQLHSSKPKKIKIRGDAISFVPLSLTWTVDPKKGYSTIDVLNAMKRKIRSLVQRKPESLIVTIEHMKTNLHFHMYLKSSIQKFRSEQLTWELGYVDRQITKVPENWMGYLVKENPFIDLSGLNEAEAMHQWETYVSDLRL